MLRNVKVEGGTNAGYSLGGSAAALLRSLRASSPFSDRTWILDSLNVTNLVTYN